MTDKPRPRVVGAAVAAFEAELAAEQAGTPMGADPGKWTWGKSVVTVTNYPPSKQIGADEVKPLPSSVAPTARTSLRTMVPLIDKCADPSSERLAHPRLIRRRAGPREVSLQRGNPVRSNLRPVSPPGTKGLSNRNRENMEDRESFEDASGLGSSQVAALQEESVDFDF